MLTIRREQMAAFEKARREDFLDRLLDHLQSRLPKRADRNWFEEQISRGLREAASYGLRSERQVAQFVEATCVHLGGFSDGPLPKPALAILCSYGMDPDRKIEKYCGWAEQLSAQEQTA